MQNPTLDRPIDATFLGYEAVVRNTDHSGQQPSASLSYALLGLTGEIGSLAAEVKKRRREGELHGLFDRAIREETGDVLWYLTHLAVLLDIELAAVAVGAGSTHSNIGAQHHQSPSSFADLQTNRTFQGPVRTDTAVDAPLRNLVMSAANAMREVDPLEGLPTALIRARLIELLRHLIAFADAANISLATCAENNIRKVLDRWPSETLVYPPLFDEHVNIPAAERLPRRLSVHFEEQTIRGACYVIQRCNGIVIGDRLTDNMHHDDGYRFHDCFHLAYAAVLGWSPVLRALLRCKRKSMPKLDEVEDGQRAQIIEEGISTWVFNQASERGLFVGLTRLDYNLLKEVRRLAGGFEVAACPLWLWERAILHGYEAYRQLREHHGGWIDIDLDQRSITYTHASSRSPVMLGA